jgi:hypothetical protein
MANGAAQLAKNDLRLDPFALPVRYTANLPGPVSATRPAVYLDRNQVIVKRTLGGIPATLTFPVSAFRGVAVSMRVNPETGDVTAIIELMHRDPSLSLPLSVAGDLGDAEDVAADWQAWGKALGLPLLIVEGDGTIREALSQMGGIVVSPVKARRMVSSLSRRRPRFLKRRKIGFAGETELLTGREIIARD